MSFTAGSTGGKYKHKHNSGTLGADWNTFISNGRLYVDYREVKYANYKENVRSYIGSSDISYVPERSDIEYNTSQIGVSGETGEAYNTQPYTVIYYWKRTA